jgi:hypothetical protein
MLIQHPPLPALDGYRLGTLAAPDARGVGNHLLWCAACRRTVLEASDVARLVRAVFEHDAVEEYTGGTRADDPAGLSADVTEACAMGKE